MEIDQLIVQLGTPDEWLDENIAVFASQDQIAQEKALLAGIKIAKELDRLKAEGITALAALLDRRDPVADEERASSLIQGFEFGAKLADALHDGLSDTDGETKVAHMMDSIVKALDEVAPGRIALAVLLDHADAGVRASAGAFLIDLIPQRVIPILREIDKPEDGSSGSFKAHWTPLAWEREGQSRFQSLNK
jgi:hypothetical protein